LSKFPVSTSPGQTLKNSTPSFAYSALNLATAIFTAALLTEYDPSSKMLYLRAISQSPIPLDMVMIFFALPLRMRGRKRLKRWMFPTTLTWKSSMRLDSSLAASSLPLFACVRLECYIYMCKYG
jgi:hypothetical protein